MGARSRVCVAAAMTLLAGTAVANPVPWVNLAGPINSKGLYGTGDNAIVFTPAIPAGGPFTYMTISGTLTSVATGTFAREACIEVTMPNGQNFVIQPFTGGSFAGSVGTPADAATVPLNGNFGSGVAILRFFETYRDSAAGVDSTWSNVQITLHNAAGGDTVPFDASIAPTSINPDVSPTQTVTVLQGGTAGGSITFPSNRIVDSVRVRGYGTAIGGTTSNYGPLLNAVSVNFTATSARTLGPVTWSAVLYSASATSSGQFDFEAAAPEPVLTGPGSPWTYTLTGTPPTAAGSPFAQIVFAAQSLYPDAPAGTDLGVMRSRISLGPIDTTSVRTVNSTIAGSQIAWYVFTTEQACSDATGCWLDIHTQFPAANSFDTEIGVYNASGLLEANDDDAGNGLRSQLSFGDSDPVRPSVNGGDEAQRSGFSGVLPSGVHYLALGRFNTQFFSNGWYAYPGNTAGGDAIIEFRTNLGPAYTPIGTIHSNTPATPVTLANNQVKWFSFDLSANVDNVTRYYVDIDTIEQGAPYNDTELGLYAPTGGMIANDDDDGGNGNRTQLSFGIGPANRPPVGTSSFGDGRDGNLTAGRYYLAAGTFNTTFATDWAAVSISGPAGSFPINFRNNFPAFGCGPADLGGAGGTPGADGALDNNDFVVFIDYFFNHNPLADVGSTGGIAGPDNQWDNNDFVVYITQFFTGCP